MDNTATKLPEAPEYIRGMADGYSSGAIDVIRDVREAAAAMASRAFMAGEDDAAGLLRSWASHLELAQKKLEDGEDYQTSSVVKPS